MSYMSIYKSRLTQNMTSQFFNHTQCQMCKSWKKPRKASTQVSPRGRLWDTWLQSAITEAESPTSMTDDWSEWWRFLSAWSDVLENQFQSMVTVMNDDAIILIMKIWWKLTLWWWKQYDSDDGDAKVGILLDRSYCPAVDKPAFPLSPSGAQSHHHTQQSQVTILMTSVIWLIQFFRFTCDFCGIHDS